MNVFILGLRVTSEAQTDEGTTNVLAEALPSNDKRVPTKVQLLQKSDHYVGKLLANLKKDQTFLALGPTRATVDGILQMQPMLVVTEENFSDLLAINLFVATGGLGPKSDEVELGDSTVTNRSLAWQAEDSETQWFKITAWNELSKQLSETRTWHTHHCGRSCLHLRERRQKLPELQPRQSSLSTKVDPQGAYQGCRS
jgi:hypothetical protein